MQRKSGDAKVIYAYIIQYYMLNLSSYLIYSIINSYSACTIYVPVEDEIILFNKLIQPYFDMISRNTCESQRLQDVRNSLLPLLINGQAVIGD